MYWQKIHLVSYFKIHTKNAIINKFYKVFLSRFFKWFLLNALMFVYFGFVYDNR